MKRHEVVVNDVIEDRTLRQKTGYVKQYRKGSYLGKGGFAKCYEMISFDSNNRYAGKVIPKASLAKSSARKKLLNEIKIHRSLKHPNVVRFERFFEDRNNVYILLELCPNQTMMECMARRKRLTEYEVQYWLWQLVDTVQYLHRHNVIHRDLKLGNIFVGPNMEVKLGDFGLATTLDHPNERKRTICGTPNYIAPEILHNKNGHSFEVDVWSMGVIMYTLLFGRPPFETRSVKSTYKRIKENVWRFPSNVRASPAAKNLIQRILHTNPAMRPTVDEMRRDPFFTQSPFPKRLPVTALSARPHVDLSDPEACVDVTTGVSQPNSYVLPMTTRSLHVNFDNDTDKENAGAEQQHRHQQHRYHRHQPQQQQQSPSQAQEAPHPSPTRSAPIAVPVLGAAGKPRHARVASAIPPEVPLSKPPASRIPVLRSSPARAPAVRTPEPPRRASNGPSPSSESEDEFRPLKQLHRNIEHSFARAAPAVAPAAAAAASAAGAEAKAPPVWVTKWVDYSHKYGVAYTLSNGMTGVYFNDATKLYTTPESGVEYVERSVRRSRRNPERARRVDCPPARYSTDVYPKTLRKKMYLLAHFAKHLRQHRSRGSLQAAQQHEQHEQQQQQQQMTRSVETAPNLGVDVPARGNDKGVYVRMYLRTKHAILFWLSNRTVQVVFFDCTEILVSSDLGTVTYTNKARERTTHELGSVFAAPRPDLERRLAYAKDILSHMLEHR